MDKYIFIKRKVLTKDSCDHLIEMFEKSELCDNIRGYKFMDANLQTSKFSFLRELLLSACAEYFKKITQDRMNAVDNDLMKEQHPDMPINIDRQSRVTFGGSRKK